MSTIDHTATPTDATRLDADPARTARPAVAPTRRTLILTAAATAALGALALPIPVAAAPRGVRAIRVDTGPLAARGLRNYAARVAAAAQPIVQREFADLITNDRSAPTAVLQIDTISLTSNPSGGVGFGMNRETDDISGAGLLIGAGGAVISREPFWTSITPTGGQRGDVLVDEDRRMRALVAQLAAWFAHSLRG